MVSNPYDNLAEIYDKMYYYPVHKLEDQFISDLIVSNSIDKGKTLDLGCGTAKILENLYFESYTGIDISKNSIRIAKSKYPQHQFYVDSMSNLFSYQNNYYNNVISLFGSFNYSNKVIDTIKGIHKVLKPGGQFMIMVYGKNYQNRKTYILKKLKIKSPAEYYNSKELLRLFNICDYSDVKVSGMTFISEYLQNKLSTTHISKLFHLENKYLSKFLLNQFFFLIITGKKYA